MSLVVDANLMTAILIPLPYSTQVTRKMMEWQDTDVTLVAPTLLEYELITALRKATVAGLLAAEEAVRAVTAFTDLHIKLIAPTPTLHALALRWSERLCQSAAYDAQYLALAEQLGVTFWTADRKLANSAKQLGVTWVYWIGEGEA